jgi:uncharacterized protein (DUF2147 family)
MLYNLFPGLMILLCSYSGLNAQVTGLWKVPDEHDGVVKSIVEIYEYNSKYYGRVSQVLDSSRHTHCESCVGDLKDKPLTGMRILDDLTKTSNGGIDGTVLNPGSGKVYSCYIELESPDRLKLRGYIGMPAFGKTLYWTRLK